ncbi:MAG: alpha/beta hydrolase [Armatimonadota bacterium]|nr:alpha/beta hydrolase [Armatimonadota bacterium]
MPVVKISGVKVTYQDAGDGLPVVFIPGLAETGECFRRQILGLSPKYRVIAYDLRAARQAEEYSISLLVRDLGELLKSLHIYNAAVCGHSVGGMIAQEFAMTYPEQTAALTLISSFPKLPVAHADRLLSWLTPRGAPRRGAVGWIRGLFGGARVDTDSPEWLSQQVAGVNRLTTEAQLRAAQSFDSTTRLGEIGAPTLVIVGEKEREEIQHSAQVLYEGIADSALEVIEDGDHFSYYFRHDLVNAAIDDFLTSRMASIS